MAKSRAPSKSTMNHGDYINFVREFFPLLPPGGICVGHAHIAKNALVSGSLDKFKQRLENIFSGVVDESGTQVDSQYLKKMIENLGLEKYLEDIHGPSHLSINTEEKSPYMARKNAILFAYKIRKSYLLKKKMELAEVKPLLSENIKHEKLQQDLQEFNERFPFINNLCEQEDFFSAIAGYQRAISFPFLSDNFYNLASQRASKYITNLLFAPIEAESDIVSALPMNYTIDRLQKIFNDLSIQLNEYIKETKEENQNQVLPLGLTIEAIIHAITVGYDKTSKKWILINANDLPIFTKEVELQNIAVEIFNAFSYMPELKSHNAETNLSKNINLAINIYVNKEKNHLKALISKWRQSNTVKEIMKLTPEMVNTQTSNQFDILSFAAAMNEIDLAKDILLANKDLINQIDERIFHYTPLMNAASHGNIEIVRFLLDCKANPNLIGGGHTALYCAIDNGFPEIVTMLLEAKADIHQKTAEGISPLVKAVDRSHTEVVRVLLKNKADPNITDIGFTPLTRATYKGRGHLEIVTLLCEAKADINVPAQENGYSPLILAALNGYTDIIKYLLNKSELNVEYVNEENTTAFFCACYAGKMSTVKVLFESKKADIDKLCGINKDFCPLSIAAISGHAEIVELLLKAGAKSDLKENKDINQSSLFKSCTSNEVKKVLTHYHKNLYESHITPITTIERKNDERQESDQPSSDLAKNTFFSSQNEKIEYTTDEKHKPSEPSLKKKKSL